MGGRFERGEDIGYARLDNGYAITLDGHSSLRRIGPPRSDPIWLGSMVTLPCGARQVGRSRGCIKKTRLLAVCDRATCSSMTSIVPGSPKRRSSEDRHLLSTSA